MKSIAISAAVAALVAPSEAIKVKTNGGPDVYGPNGIDYQNNSADYDMSRIGIDFLEHGKGPACTLGDWTTVHWKGSLMDGRVFTDSHDEPDGRPKIFTLGDHQVLKCWDLALQSARQGDKLHITCPSYFAYGGAFTASSVGGEPVPLNSDVQFEIDVIQCARTPEFVKQVLQPTTTTMQDNVCMYLHWKETDDLAEDLVLSSNGWPGEDSKFELLKMDHWQRNDKAQQWFYNHETGEFWNALYPNQRLDYQSHLGEDSREAIYNHNAGFLATPKVPNSFNADVAEASKPKKFYYDPVTSAITTEYQGTHYELGTPLNGKIRVNSPLTWLPVDYNNAKLATWRIDYCASSAFNQQE